jgi:hypothetical protein
LGAPVTTRTVDGPPVSRSARRTPRVDSGTGASAVMRATTVPSATRSMLSTSVPVSTSTRRSVSSGASRVA